TALTTSCADPADPGGRSSRSPNVPSINNEISSSGDGPPPAVHSPTFSAFSSACRDNLSIWRYADSGVPTTKRHSRSSAASDAGLPARNGYVRVAPWNAACGPVFSYAASGSTISVDRQNSHSWGTRLSSPSFLHQRCTWANVNGSAGKTLSAANSRASATSRGGSPSRTDT